MDTHAGYIMWITSTHDAWLTALSNGGAREVEEQAHGSLHCQTVAVALSFPAQYQLCSLSDLHLVTYIRQVAGFSRFLSLW